VTLEIRRNEYLAIMGPSGSGKSTLMNMLGCLDTPTAGRYEFTGKNVATMSDDELADIRNREIGFVFPDLQPAPALRTRCTTSSCPWSTPASAARCASNAPARRSRTWAW
jgi:ABC-type lipoprotein export system ATPase subunit